MQGRRPEGEEVGLSQVLQSFRSNLFIFLKNRDLEPGTFYPEPFNLGLKKIDCHSR
jgi:hypothetical protein